MRKTLLIFLNVLFVNIAMAQTTSITGKISNSDDKTPIAGASLMIKGTVAGTVANNSGDFTLRTNQALPFTIRVTAIGYLQQEVVVKNSESLNIALKESIGTLEEIQVTGNRVEESITKAPVTVEKLGVKQILNGASADVFSLLQNLKGVDLLTQSLGFKSVNIRGFGANNNNRFVQLTDGMDNRSPGFGFGFGAAAGVSDIDIESIEILPGASSALYGPDALQGLMLTKTKSPFEYQGLSAQAKLGVNNVGKDNIGAKPYTDFALRYAKQIGKNFAFKINFQTINGTDFIADNVDDRSHRARPGFFVVDGNAVRVGFTPNNNPSTNLSYDGVNIYGDDFNNSGAFTYPAVYPSAPALAGKTVTRTGYSELDLLQNDGKFKSLRANVALHYKLTDKIEVIGAWYYGNGNFIRTAGNREYYPDYNRHQIKLELRADEWFLRGYTTMQAAEGYNLASLAQRMLQISKPTATWGANFATAYAANGGNITDARNAADAGKFLVGDANFNKYYNDLSTTLSTDFIPGSTTIRGVRILDNSSLSHVEGMYNFKKILPEAVEIITGASFRRYSLLTKRTIFPVSKIDGSEFTINEYGWYTQGSVKLKLSDNITFKPIVAVRYDKNQYFDGGFTPRVSGVLTFGQHNIRASWQSAFRNPSPNQLLADGGTGEVGGSQASIDGANLIANPAYTEASANAYRASINATTPNGNESLLVKYVPNPSAFTTEKIKTWEIGYKALLSNKFFVDAFYFNSTYNDFIATQNYNQPKTVGQISDLRTSANYTTYGINFNNFNEIYVTGFGFGLEYALGGGYNIGANYANQVGSITLKDNGGNIIKDAFGNEIVKRKMSNPEVSRVQRNFFISPEDRYNVSFSNPKLTKNLGFNITYRWTSDMWVEQGATAGDITLPSWSTFDASVSYKIPSMKTMLKVGGSNIFNKYYSQGYGLANIGGLYYVSLNFDEIFR
jgi:iron complex outermembrane recepter protein